MFLRQLTANLLRRTRFRSERSITYRTGSHQRFPILVSEKGKYYHRHSQLLWLFISAQPALIFGIGSGTASADGNSSSLIPEKDVEAPNMTGLQKIEDGSVVSNEHTSKWRIFTDRGRELFMQGKIDEAEKLFQSAINEAKQGFGEQDPHVASAYNNLAELYRLRKLYDKAEPLYQQAINILKESFGEEDVRVGAALHNLGQFYLVQKKLEEARACYESTEGEDISFELKGRVLGHGHTDYADTMYHLGTVLYLQGKEKDAEAFIQDSIQILEEGGQGESYICLRRLRYLAQIYMKSNRLGEAENIQRKILHIMELIKGWNTIETVISAESLAKTLQASGKLIDAQELLERCLDVRKSLLPKNHIQVAANMLSLARVLMLKAHDHTKLETSQAVIELERERNLLEGSSRIARSVLKQKRSRHTEDFGRSAQTALIILLQSLNALGRLEISKQEFKELQEASTSEAEKLFSECISTFRQYAAGESTTAPTEAKVEYLSCLKHYLSLTSDPAMKNTETEGNSVEELKDEIKRIEAEIPTK